MTRDSAGRLWWGEPPETSPLAPTPEALAASVRGLAAWRAWLEARRQAETLERRLRWCRDRVGVRALVTEIQSASELEPVRDRLLALARERWSALPAVKEAP